MNLVERTTAVWQHFTGNTEGIIALVVSILVFATLYYYVMKFLVDNKAGLMLMLFVFCMFVGAAILTFMADVNGGIYLIIPAVFIIAILVLYSVEIKRIIWYRKSIKAENAKNSELSYDEEKIRDCISEIIKALQNMSKNDVGAIIVLSTGNVDEQILASGVKLDSDISSELIESVFFPKTPLHDGAMIINGTKIVSAGCFLPLSQNVDKIPKDLGTRHRAGIGITETNDVISLIVSEETGIISVVNAGKIVRYADTEMLKKTLKNYYWQEQMSGRR